MRIAAASSARHGCYSSTVTGVSSMSREQLDIFKALSIEKPNVGTDNLIV
jgi:hypothetical protein